MSLQLIDRLVAREVGRLCWTALPKMFPDFTAGDKNEFFRDVWSGDDEEAIKQFWLQNPRIDCPAIFPDAPGGPEGLLETFAFPAITGASLQLVDYVHALKDFIFLQLTEPDVAAVRLLNIVRSLAKEIQRENVLEFVDQLWRGRWIVNDTEWAILRTSVITGGTPTDRIRLEDDIERLESEAVRLILSLRALKDSARSMDEWLHEAYCLLPDIVTWHQMIRRANERHSLDELGKYERVLDEFYADLHTTLLIAGSQGGAGLAETYFIQPLTEKRLNADAAIKELRGIYRGRSIISKVWYEMGRDILMTQHNSGKPVQVASIPSEELNKLMAIDLAASFGRAVTSQSRQDLWLFLSFAFDYYE